MILQHGTVISKGLNFFVKDINAWVPIAEYCSFQKYLICIHCIYYPENRLKIKFCRTVEEQKKRSLLLSGTSWPCCKEPKYFTASAETVPLLSLSFEALMSKDFPLSYLIAPFPNHLFVANTPLNGRSVFTPYHSIYSHYLVKSD